jgi:hypothetical protein
VYWLPTLRGRRAGPRRDLLLVMEGDLCVVMGAGDVDALGRSAGGGMSGRFGER